MKIPGIYEKKDGVFFCVTAEMITCARVYIREAIISLSLSLSLSAKTVPQPAKKRVGRHLLSRETAHLFITFALLYFYSNTAAKIHLLFYMAKRYSHFFSYRLYF
jgi:hypothetical protein